MATTEKTLPISSGFTILVIIDRNTVVDVESRNAIALPIYSIHSVVQNAHISVFITDVGASVKRKAYDEEYFLENLIDRNYLQSTIRLSILTYKRYYGVMNFQVS